MAVTSALLAEVAGLACKHCHNALPVAVASGFHSGLPSLEDKVPHEDRVPYTTRVVQYFQVVARLLAAAVAAELVVPAAYWSVKAQCPPTCFRRSTCRTPHLHPRVAYTNGNGRGSAGK